MTMEKRVESYSEQQARLDAVALARATLNGDQEARTNLLTLCEDPLSLLEAALGLLTALLVVQGDPMSILDQLTVVTLAEGGG